MKAAHTTTYDTGQDGINYGYHRDPVQAIGSMRQDVVDRYAQFGSTDDDTVRNAEFSLDGADTVHTGDGPKSVGSVPALFWGNDESALAAHGLDAGRLMVLPNRIEYTFGEAGEKDDDTGKKKPKKSTLSTKRICPFFTVFGSGYDTTSKGAVLIIRFVGRHGKSQTLSIPKSTIASGGKDLAVFCASRGFDVATGMAERSLLQNLLTALKGPRVSVASRTGWHGDSLGFVLPDGSVLGDGSARVYFADDRASQVYVKTGGDFQKWQDGIAELVPGNSRLVLSLCAAFASPLLRFATVVNSTIVNIYGESSRGKSTTSFLYGSVWGGDTERPEMRFAHPWKQTANNAVALCAAHSGIGMIFDELKLCPNPGEIAYAVSMGEEKGRQDANLQMREARRWRLIVFSTGEKTLDEAIEEHERRDNTSSGTGVRCVDVPAVASEHGVFEVLNGLPSGADMADAINMLTASNYGHAGPAYVSALSAFVREQSEGGDDAATTAFKAMVSQGIGAFVASLALPDGVDPTVLRVARVFGLLQVAGLLAIKFGVLPLDRTEIERGMRKCFNDWARARGSISKSAAQQKGVLTLRDYINNNPAGFVDVDNVRSLNDYEIAVGRAKPFVGHIRTVSGARYYLLAPGAWKTVAKQAKRGDLAAQLVDLGLMATEDGGAAKAQKVYSGGRNEEDVVVRAYRVDARVALLDDECRLSDDGEADLEHPQATTQFTARVPRAEAGLENLRRILDKVGIRDGENEPEREDEYDGE